MLDERFYEDRLSEHETSPEEYDRMHGAEIAENASDDLDDILMDLKLAKEYRPSEKIDEAIQAVQNAIDLLGDVVSGAD